MVAGSCKSEANIFCYVCIGEVVVVCVSGGIFICNLLLFQVLKKKNESSKKYFIVLVKILVFIFFIFVLYLFPFITLLFSCIVLISIYLFVTNMRAPDVQPGVCTQLFLFIYLFFISNSSAESDFFETAMLLLLSLMIEDSTVNLTCSLYHLPPPPPSPLLPSSVSNQFVSPDCASKL